MIDSLKNLRVKANLNTKEAARNLGISLSLLYKLEQGNKKPSRALIEKISKIYGCSIENIFMALKVTESDKTKAV